MLFLFVKTELGWPRTSGHDVHSYSVMQALSRLGHEIALLTLIAPQAQALEGLQLCDQKLMPACSPEPCPYAPDDKFLPADMVAQSSSERSCSDQHWKQRWSWRQERFRSYWGIEAQHIRFTREHARALKADAVVAVGMEVLPYLSEVREQARIWYAADEWVWHHLSLMHPLQPKTWAHLKQSLILGLYEHSFASVVDRAWVVSRADQRAMRWVTGNTEVDVIPNGVDAMSFSPTEEAVEPLTCTFWGCLSFAPNEQALLWFCHQVWPLVRRKLPDAQFRIFGFNPSARVLKLADFAGVSITPNVPDIRLAVSRQAVVVLPFHSGGGVKNKLLEAASLAKPIVCSTRACNGLNAVDDAPFAILTGQPQRWADTLESLWADADRCQSMGIRARQWVTANHSWQAAAEKAILHLGDQPVAQANPGT